MVYESDRTSPHDRRVLDMEGITHEYVFDPVWRDGKVIHRGKCRCGWIAIEWHNKANPAYNDWHQHFLDVKAGNQWKPSEPI